MLAGRTGLLSVGLAAALALPGVGPAGVVPSSKVARSATPKWLTTIDYYRKGAGLSSVSNDPTWDKGILNHLRYLEKTPARYRTGEYASAHTENPKSPYYTESGALEGERSDLILGYVSGDVAAIDEWLTSPFHAIGMLRPGLHSVALAVGYDGAGLDVLGGLGSASQTAPVVFPGNGSTTALNAYSGDELPNPLQSCHWSRAAHFSDAGLLLIVQLQSAPAKGASATLTTPSGKVESSKAGTFCLVDQNDWYSTDKVYGPTGLEILEYDHAVLLIPDKPLQKGTYKVDLSGAQSTPVSWSFRDTS